MPALIFEKPIILSQSFLDKQQYKDNKVYITET